MFKELYHCKSIIVQNRLKILNRLTSKTDLKFTVHLKQIMSDVDNTCSDKIDINPPKTTMYKIVRILLKKQKSWKNRKNPFIKDPIKDVT